eukprot:CAMPEP_0185032656 /NCGR_PEP_ID=MMETSP1103-20130426/20910_1 /TAXON_ID=36769 /ORGANISM="Paraphysomonas bandaiensis, Strain Caron Lab Isolate" /LENGTH=630 /DNA_ID=CAMNT_0027568633 /DNA_START=145 /DNA_END=2037 /DNA_ORIENTATION=+
MDSMEDFDDLIELEEEKTVSPPELKTGTHVDYFLYRNMKDDMFENLEAYIEWHKTHPHASTPRKPKGNIDQAISAGTLFEHPENPELVYFMAGPKGVEDSEYYEDFQPKLLGSDAEFKAVNEVAYEHEHKLRLENRFDYDDPWWQHSVRDQASVHHVREPPKIDDGSLYDPSENPVVLPDIEGILREKREKREAALRERQDRLAVSSDWGKPPRSKASARKKQDRRSQYTAGGTHELEEFERREFEKEVTAALEEFHSHDNSLMGQPAGISASALEFARTIEGYKDQLGGEEKVDKMSQKIIKYATKIRKEQDKGKSIFDGAGVDFLDACMKVNAVKAIPMLNFGADPDTLTEEEEPVLFMLVNKVIMRDITKGGDVRKGDKERKNCFKILNSLVEFGAKVDFFVGDESYSPLHHAASAGNVDLVEFLLKSGANPNIRCPKTKISPLMLMAKFSHAECVMLMIQYKADMDVRDSEGKTALHYCAEFGQTKMSKFMLRLGAKRELRDNFDRTAAELALECGNMVVAQTIMGYAPKFKHAKDPLEFLNAQIAQRIIDEANRNKGVLGRMGSNVKNVIGGAMKRIGNIFGSKDAEEGWWERLKDRMIEKYRWYKDNDFKDWFKRSSDATVHPE